MDASTSACTSTFELPVFFSLQCVPRHCFIDKIRWQHPPENWHILSSAVIGIPGGGAGGGRPGGGESANFRCRRASQVLVGASGGAWISDGEPAERGRHLRRTIIRFRDVHSQVGGCGCRQERRLAIDAIEIVQRQSAARCVGPGVKHARTAQVGLVLRDGGRRSCSMRR